MKKLMIIAAVAATWCLSPGGAAGQDGGDEVIAATIRADGSTNVWTRADAVEALGLINRKYWRDMQTESGRRQWHGRVRTRIDEELEIKVWEYEDGFAWTNRWTRPKSKAERDIEAARRAAEAEAARGEGTTPDIAEIYRRRAAAITNTTNEVTVIIAP